MFLHWVFAWPSLQIPGGTFSRLFRPSPNRANGQYPEFYDLICEKGMNWSSLDHRLLSHDRMTRNPYKWQFATDNGCYQAVNAAGHFGGLPTFRPSGSAKPSAFLVASLRQGLAGNACVIRSTKDENTLWLFCFPGNLRLSSPLLHGPGVQGLAPGHTLSG